MVSRVGDMLVPSGAENGNGNIPDGLDNDFTEQ